MKMRLSRLLLALVLGSCVCLVPGATAQRRRTRPSRRVTHPVRQQAPVPVPSRQAGTSEPTLVSTADEGSSGEEAQPRRTSSRARRAPAPETEADPEKVELRRTVTRLTTQVNRLTEDLSQIRADQRSMVELERLTRAEQRAESLRAQLRDVTDKEFALQERAAQIEDQLDPGAIERQAALVGTLNPSAVRDQIRRGLERERDRVRTQLEMLGQSRTRLEAAITSADAEVEHLRQRLDAADATANSTTGGGNTGAQPAATPTPTPSDTNTSAQPPR